MESIHISIKVILSLYPRYLAQSISTISAQKLKIMMVGGRIMHCYDVTFDIVKVCVYKHYYLSVLMYV